MPRRDPARRASPLALAGWLSVLFVLVGAVVPYLPWHEASDPPLPQPVAAFRDPAASIDRAAVVETNEDALTTRLHLIRSARHEVVLTTFDFRADASGSDVLAELLAAADRGVGVRIVVDGLAGALVRMRGTPEFHAVAEHPLVEVRAYNVPSLLEPWTLLGRYHDKLVVADRSLLLLGGRNTYDFFLGDYPTDHPSLDREALVYADAAGAGGRTVVDDAAAYVDGVWRGPDVVEVLEERPLGLTDAAVADAGARLRAGAERRAASDATVLDADHWRARTMPVDRVTLVTNPTHPGSKQPVLWETLMALAATGREDVVLQTPYYVGSDAMDADLAALAAGRRTRLLVNAPPTGDNLVASGDYRLQRPRVLATGVELLEYFGDRSSHAKSAVIDDDLSVIGSFNLDMMSVHGNTESVLVIAGEEFNARLRTHFDTALEQSARVRPDGSYETPSGEPPQPTPPERAVLLSVLGVLTWPVRFLL